MGHGHHHHHSEESGDKKLALALAVNVLLTVVQIIGGIFSGSLALISDAVHNLSDAVALGIALFARKIGRKPADEFKTFGYKRAEAVAALINLTTLVLIGAWLIFEAIWRFFEPQAIEGWIVVWLAGAALLVDTVTALLTYALSKESANVRAAFLHNLSDAFASVGVIISGALILLFGWVWADAVATLVISAYILWQAFAMLPATVHLLMEGAPAHLSLDEVKAAMAAVEGVENVHHLHCWQLDEQRIALEAHVAVKECNLASLERIKQAVKAELKEKFSIAHSTLEMEIDGLACGNADNHKH